MKFSPKTAAIKKSRTNKLNCIRYATDIFSLIDDNSQISVMSEKNKSYEGGILATSFNEQDYEC